MPFIVDFSFAHAAVTTALVERKLGEHCIGGIAYAGSDDDDKNITKAELHALLAAGYQMSLTIENRAADLIGGAPVGTAHGKAIVAAAKDLGYDWQNCLLGNGYDTDSHPDDWPKLLAAMEAFAAVVPVPGFYGDSDAIDFLHARHPNWVYWQSASSSFSPLNPTPRAHLLQRFADSRANPLGSSVDVNDIQRTPLMMMGEQDMALSQEDKDWIKQQVAGVEGDVFKHPVTQDTAGNDVTLTELLRGLRTRSLASAEQLRQLEAELAALPTGADGGLTKADVVAAVRRVFGDAATAPSP